MIGNRSARVGKEVHEYDCMQILRLNGLSFRSPLNHLHKLTTSSAMMDRFVVAQDVTKMLPKMQVVIVTAYNLDNQSKNPSVDAFASVLPVLQKPPTINRIN